MRPATASEVILLARALMRFHVGHRPAAAHRLLAETAAASRQFAATGCAHPAFGDGSLAARCLLADPVAEPFADDVEFLTSLIVAARAVLRHSRA